MKAKKSYGQHFLNSPQIGERIAGSLRQTDVYGKVLEVGPGRGMLTKYLLKRGVDLVVVEADPDMVLYLNRHFPELKGRIIQADFLKVPLDRLFDDQAFGLIGNFPYNISSQILFRMLDYRKQIPEMVGMFQKEVAERIVAGPGSKTYGIISVLVQAYYEGEYLFGVDRRKFTPPPRVQSAVIRLTRKTEWQLDCNEELFRKTVKLAFSQRRKMLRNTMKLLVPDAEMLAEEFFKQRPEALSVEDFINLSKRIEKYHG